MSETDPDHCTPHVVIVVSPVDNGTQAYGAVTGAWAACAANV